jgi:hypothetical protein
MIIYRLLALFVAGMMIVVMWRERDWRSQLFCRAGVCAVHPARSGDEVTTAAESSRLRAFAFSVAALAVAGAAGWIFWSMLEAEPNVAGGVTNQRMLSAIEPSLAGGPGDTPVFELAG